jgi:hypothetical protein
MGFIEPQKQYDENASLLKLIVDARDRHMTAHPDCPAAPMCVGGKTALLMQELDEVKPGEALGLLFTAIGEMSNLWTSVALLNAQLQDAQAVVEGLGSQNTELERQVAALTAELTIWEDAAGSLAPAGVPHE